MGSRIGANNFQNEHRQQENLLFQLATASRTKTDDKITYCINCKRSHSSHKNQLLEALIQLDARYGETGMIETENGLIRYETNNPNFKIMVDNERIAVNISRAFQNYDWNLNGPKPIDFATIENCFPPNSVNPNRIVVVLGNHGIKVNFDENDMPVINDSQSLCNLMDMAEAHQSLAHKSAQSARR